MSLTLLLKKQSRLSNKTPPPSPLPQPRPISGAGWGRAARTRGSALSVAFCPWKGAELGLFRPPTHGDVPVLAAGPTDAPFPRTRCNPRQFARCLLIKI